MKIKDKSLRKILEEAIWYYEGKKGEPHVVLSSGKHSDGYVNLSAILQSPDRCRVLARRLIQKLKKENVLTQTTQIDVVISSSYGALTLGHEVAEQLKCMFVFTEKEGKTQKWSGRFTLPEGAVALQVEDVVTTLNTARKVKQEILKNTRVEFLKKEGKTVLATVVHRPQKLPISYPDYYIVALIELAINVWEPNQCLLCSIGSKAVSPKENWQLFKK